MADNKQREEVNVVKLAGKLAGTPAVKMAQSGKTYADFLLDVEGYKDRVDRIPLVAFGDNATLLSEMRSGEYVRILARLGSKSAETRNGQTYYRVSVIANKIARRAGDRPAILDEGKMPPAPAPAPAPAKQNDDEDFPF